MSKKTKSKNNIFEPKNLLVVGIAATAVIFVAVLMNMLTLTKVKNEQALDKAKQNTSVTEVKDNKSAAEADSGLTSVYDKSAVAAAAESVPQAAEEANPDKAPQDSDSSSKMIMPISGEIIKDYSGGELVYSQTMNDWRTHNGIDFATEEGTEVFAVADGTVEAVTNVGMLGTTVIILHKDGVRSIYSNLADKVSITVGDSVTRGSILGKTGDTAFGESAEAPHLHFEISLNEEPVNPKDYLPIKTD